MVLIQLLVGGLGLLEYTSSLNGKFVVPRLALTPPLLKQDTYITLLL